MSPYRTLAEMPKPRSSVGNFVATYLAASFGLVACGLFAGGLPVSTPKSQDYAETVARCRETSASCADFVACQHQAQTKAGYPITGSCDGGTDASAR